VLLGLTVVSIAILVLWLLANENARLRRPYDGTVVTLQAEPGNAAPVQREQQGKDCQRPLMSPPDHTMAEL
jgi:hypothetical protein